ncbi:MAG TPA: hypothetical protein VGL44_09025 [Gaiellales bacterium]
MSTPRRLHRCAAVLVIGAACTTIGAAAAAAGSAHHPAPPALGVAGRPAGLLAPGRAVPIELALTNRRRFAVRVTRVVVSIGRTSVRGCGLRSNFRVRQLRLRRPIGLRPRSTRTLAQLGYGRVLWPRLVMLDTAANQDACADARVHLVYSAAGRRAR